MVLYCYCSFEISLDIYLYNFVSIRMQKTNLKFSKIFRIKYFVLTIFLPAVRYKIIIIKFSKQ